MKFVIGEAGFSFLCFKISIVMKTTVALQGRTKTPNIKNNYNRSPFLPTHTLPVYDEDVYLESIDGLWSRLFAQVSYL